MISCCLQSNMKVLLFCVVSLSAVLCAANKDTESLAAATTAKPPDNLYPGKWTCGVQKGMSTTFPQCNFSLECPEILSQIDICYHSLIVSGIWKIMHFGILINLPYYSACCPLLCKELRSKYRWAYCKDFEFIGTAIRYFFSISPWIKQINIECE